MRFIARVRPRESGARATLTALVMRILDRYIVREVFRHAFLGLVVFTFVFFVTACPADGVFVRHTARARKSRNDFAGSLCGSGRGQKPSASSDGSLVSDAKTSGR